MCEWDASAFVLKASLLSSEDVLLRDWIAGYLGAFTCYPSLLVITDSKQMPKASRMFDGVPNVTIQANRFPPVVKHTNMQTFMQWPTLSLDLRLPPAAAHIFYWDVDATPVLPAQCHHFFDATQRPFWYSRAWPMPSPWVRASSAVIEAGLKANASFGSLPEVRRRWERLKQRDFVTLYPIVIPRQTLSMAREMVSLAYGRGVPIDGYVARDGKGRTGTRFDHAWAKCGGTCSHIDIVAKVAAVFAPETVHAVPCAAASGAAADPESAGATKPDPCADLVFGSEHVRHPVRNIWDGNEYELERGNAFHVPSRAHEHAAHLLDVATPLRRAANSSAAGGADHGGAQAVQAHARRAIESGLFFFRPEANRSVGALHRIAAQWAGQGWRARGPAATRRCGVRARHSERA